MVSSAASRSGSISAGAKPSGIAKRTLPHLRDLERVRLRRPSHRSSRDRSASLPAVALERRGEHGRGAGEEPGSLERGCERHAAGARDATERGLQSEDPAERRRQPDRTAGVGADREVDDSCRDRGGRPAARTARHPLEVPRVARRATRRVLRRDAPTELVRPSDAGDHRARRPQALHDQRVAARR